MQPLTEPVKRSPSPICRKSKDQKHDWKEVKINVFNRFKGQDEVTDAAQCKNCFAIAYE